MTAVVGVRATIILVFRTPRLYSLSFTLLFPQRLLVMFLFDRNKLHPSSVSSLPFALVFCAVGYVVTRPPGVPFTGLMIAHMAAPVSAGFIFRKPVLMVAI